MRVAEKPGVKPPLTWGQAGVLLLVAVCLGRLAIVQPWRLSFNLTPSEPIGLYAYKQILPGKSAQVSLHDLVLFQYSAPSWALGRYAHNGQLFLKRIGATSGTFLILRGRQVLACSSSATKDCTLLGVGLRRDSSGRVLPPPPLSLAGYIPAGWVYMQSTEVKNSYDSRYFGLVPISAIKGEAHPLLIKYWGTHEN
jgi:type IV secretory pathway protease TraF